MENTVPSRRRPGGSPDALASTSFIMGLVGLVVLPICLGPVAVVLAALALRKGTRLRRRAQLGLGFGVADLVVFAVVLAVEQDWIAPLL